MSTSKTIKIAEISVTNSALKNITPNASTVVSVDIQKFDEELNLTLNELSAAIGTAPGADYGISATSPIPISIDIDKYVDLTLTMKPSWMYMTKVDMNVYLSAIDPNYGEYMAIPVKGILVLNSPNFDNLGDNKHLEIITNHNCQYSYFGSNLDILTKDGEGLSVLKNTDCGESDGYYRWCTVYACLRNLIYTDVLSTLDIKYIALSDENGKVLNSLSTSISSMDFSYLNEPFIMNKDYDYIFVLRTRYVPNLSSYSFFSPESMQDVTYFRCSQYCLKSEIDVTYLSSVLHGNCWIGWSDSHWLSSNLSDKNMYWIWNSQNPTPTLAAHSHKYISPFNLVKAKDGFTLLSTTVITKYIADNIYANKTKYSIDGRQKLLGQVSINEFSSFDSYKKNIMSAKDYDIYLMKNAPLNAHDYIISNVEDPSDNRDAANKQYVDSIYSALSTETFTSLRDIDMTDVKELTAVINVLSTIVQRFSK